MQSLDVISINIWQIIISLCNLLIIYLILRKFLYAPVRKMLDEREQAVGRQYADAEQAKTAAEADRAALEERLQGARAEADAIVKTAADTAARQGEQLVAAAQEKADRIVRQAEADAELERQKAQSSVKQEIVDISALMAERLLQREITPADHRAMIDGFIDGIGEPDGE